MAITEYEIADGPHAGHVISSPVQIWGISLTGTDAGGNRCLAHYEVQFLNMPSGRWRLGLDRLEYPPADAVAA